MNLFRQLSDDQLALLLCGMAMLGCWCILQISYYLGRSATPKQSVILRPGLRTNEPDQQREAA